MTPERINELRELALISLPRLGSAVTEGLREALDEIERLRAILHLDEQTQSALQELRDCWADEIE